MTADGSDEHSAQTSATRTAHGLCLAATPTFAILGAITAMAPAGMVMCGGSVAFLPISDMALMYLLMSLFHLPPWLRLLRRRRPGRQAPVTPIEGD